MRTLLQGPLPVTAPLVLNPLMARMVEAAGFGAGYLGGGATGYQKAALEANLNVTEMCQAAPSSRCKHGPHLFTGQDHRQSLRPLRAHDVVQPGNVQIEHLLVEEQQRAQGLVLGRGGHVPVDRKPAQEASERSWSGAQRRYFSNQAKTFFRPSTAAAWR